MLTSLITVIVYFHSHLIVDMKADRAISITIICNQDRFSSKRIFLEDQPLQKNQPTSGTDGLHPHDDGAVTIGATSDTTGGRTLETFRSWLQQNILAELDF